MTRPLGTAASPGSHSWGKEPRRSPPNPALKSSRTGWAPTRYSRLEIFNTDQGSQFTSFAFTGSLEAAEIRISMTGRGRFTDNIFIERLWPSLKYEAVYPARDRRRLLGPVRHRRLDRLL